MHFLKVLIVGFQKPKKSKKIIGPIFFYVSSNLDGVKMNLVIIYPIFIKILTLNRLYLIICCDSGVLKSIKYVTLTQTDIM